MARAVVPKAQACSALSGETDWVDGHAPRRASAKPSASSFDLRNTPPKAATRPAALGDHQTQVAGDAHFVLNFERGSELHSELRKELAEHRWELAGAAA